MTTDFFGHTVPENWLVMPVGETAEKVMVGIASAATHAYVKKGKVLLRNKNIKPGYIDDNDIIYIDNEYEKSHKNKRLKKGDIITVRTGYPGISAVVPEKHEGSQCFTSLITRPKKHIVLSDYLCSFINSVFGEKQFMRGQAGGAQKNVNAATLAKMIIPLPPIAEQLAIVSLLSYWDEAISHLKLIIIEKKNLRKGLMQQLFSGKLRLPEYIKNKETQETKYGHIPLDWEYPEIRAIAKEISKKNNGGQKFAVLSCTKHQGLVDSCKYFGKRIHSEDISTYKIVSLNQFAYATNHIEEGSIGYQNIYDQAVISPMYTVFETNNQVDDDYLYLLLKTEKYLHIFKAHTNASVDRRGSLRWKDFSMLHIPLPCMGEQKSIANTFKLVDTEIGILRKQLEALKEQKKGLMQQLLTGKKRIKTTEAA